MIINRLRIPIPQERAMEDAIAQTAKAAADIDYVAMMADIDIPAEEGANDDVRED